MQQQIGIQENGRKQLYVLKGREDVHKRKQMYFLSEKETSTFLCPLR